MPRNEHKRNARLQAQLDAELQHLHDLDDKPLSICQDCGQPFHSSVYESSCRQCAIQFENQLISLVS